MAPANRPEWQIDLLSQESWTHHEFVSGALLGRDPNSEPSSAEEWDAERHRIERFVNAAIRAGQLRVEYWHAATEDAPSGEYDVQRDAALHFIAENRRRFPRCPFTVDDLKTESDPHGGSASAPANAADSTHQSKEEHASEPPASPVQIDKPVGGTNRQDTPVGASDSKSTMPSANIFRRMPSSAGDRRAHVDDFLKRCNEVSGVLVKIKRTQIWRFAKHKHPRQFQRWQKGDPKASRSDDDTFSRILSMDPTDFVQQLRDRGVL